MPIKCKIVFNTQQEMVEWILRQKGGPMGGLLGEEKGKPVYYSPGWFKKTPEVNTKAELEIHTCGVCEQNTCGVCREEQDKEYSTCCEACGLLTCEDCLVSGSSRFVCYRCEPPVDNDDYQFCEHCGEIHHYEDKCRY